MPHFFYIYFIYTEVWIYFCFLLSFFDIFLLLFDYHSLPFLSFCHRDLRRLRLNHQQSPKRIVHLVKSVDLPTCFYVTVFHVPQTVIKMNTFGCSFVFKNFYFFYLKIEFNWIKVCLLNFNTFNSCGKERKNFVNNLISIKVRCCTHYNVKKIIKNRKILKQYKLMLNQWK